MSRGRRWAIWIAALVGLPLALAIIAIVAAIQFGVSIDGSRWRDAASHRASAALGRPVILQGALQLTLGRELVLRVSGVQIKNPAGFTSPDLLTVGEVSARLGLFETLRGQPRLRGIEASDMGLWLERAADGRGNWESAQQRDPASPQTEIDIGQIMLNRVALRYHDVRSQTRRLVELDELSASAARNDRLRLALRGRMEKQVPFSVTLDGGPLQIIQRGSEPWPFTLDLAASGGRLQAGGVLDLRLGEARFHFDAGAEDLPRLGRLLGVELPQMGVVALSGTVVAAADALALTSLQGSVGESEFSGQLALALAGPRPRLSGALNVATADLRPFLAAEPDPQGQPFDYDALLQQAQPLRDLVPFDADVDLGVGRWLGLPVDIRDTRVALTADAQGLRAPMSAALAGAMVSGRLDLDTAAPVPQLALELAAKNVALGDVVQELTGARDMEGTLGRLGLRLDGRGETLGALVRDLELSLALAAARLSLGNVADAKPLTVQLDTLELAVGRDQPLRGRARGSLLGERATLSIRGGTVPAMLRERSTPVELKLAVADATLRVGSLISLDETGRDTALSFDFQAPRSGDLARWLDVAPESNLPVALRGRARITDEAWILDQTTLKLGRSELTIDARHPRSGDAPITLASVRSPLIDVPELLTLSATVPATGAGEGLGSRLDALLVPGPVSLPDADLELDLKRLALGGTDLVDVSVLARSREGRLLPSAVKGQLAGAPFAALVELDLRGELPFGELDLSTGAIDVGALLREFGVAEDIDGRAESLHVKLIGRGNSLRAFAAQSALDVHLVGGSITLLGAAQRPIADIRVDKVIISTPAGEPIRVRLDGSLDQTPVKIEVSTGTLVDFATDPSHLPFAVLVQAAGARLKLDGAVALPLGSEGELTFEMSGERLDTLSELARTDLPAWGPWSLRGPIRMTSTGYEMDGILLNVGRSRLGGTIQLDFSGPRPYLRLRVSAPSIQLDDFPMPERLADAPPKPTSVEELRVAASEAAGQTDRVLSARFLRRFDASIDVEAREVLSGADRLAGGELHLKLKEGRLDLDPAIVNVPGGSLRLSMSYDLKESEIDFAATASVERFDYGIIARRMGRGDDIRGLFSLNLKLAGKAPSLNTLMQKASGSIDLAVWPTELRSGIFNLWSVNMVLRLLPLFDPGGESQVNCVVGRLDLRDGQLDDDKIIIDTTALRIRGTGHANLVTEELDFVFRPRAKGVALFRLQTPLRVGGTLTEQTFSVKWFDVVGSVARLVASPVLLPIERITLGPLPRDGADVCTDPLRAIQN
jgi:AsmA family protein